MGLGFLGSLPSGELGGRNLRGGAGVTGMARSSSVACHSSITGGVPMLQEWMVISETVSEGVGWLLGEEMRGA
jgi:hypothetical protein